MQCDVCHKGNATVHLTEIVDNQITELHLCEDCARQKGAQMEQHFGLADLLAGLADLGQQFEGQGVSDGKCPSCGLTYQDFKRVGRLGCSECYSAFKDSLKVLLKRIHGSTQHLGRVPIEQKKQIKKSLRVIRSLKEKPDELAVLRAKLQKAIEVEEFEQAAKLRDKIKAIEVKNKKK